MNQYDFRMTLFNEAKGQMEKSNGVYSLQEIRGELRKAEHTIGYRLVEFHARKLSPQADKLKPEK